MAWQVRSLRPLLNHEAVVVRFSTEEEAFEEAFKLAENYSRKRGRDLEVEACERFATS